MGAAFTRWGAGLALAASMVLGCGGSEDGAGVPIGSYDEAAFEAVCDFIHRCEMAEDDLIWIRILTGSPQDCVELFSREANTFSLDLQLAVSEGSALYDPVQARRCLDRIGESCSVGAMTLWAEGPRCPSAFEGTLGIGESCYISEQCAGDATCDTASGLSCPGSCAARRGLAAACERDDECTKASGDSVCGYVASLGGMRCVLSAAAPDAAEGEACGRVETETRFELTMCEPGTWCERATEICKAPIAAGATCFDRDDVCVAGYVCQDHTCQALSVEPEGASCGSPLEICDPFARLQCQGGICVVFTDGALGS
ncbi:MAG: hypothetical protein OEY14_05020, partial [Myxococcales bacterium]|nr:hypothetical protein [Myxococcales bacterium]